MIGSGIRLVMCLCVGGWLVHSANCNTERLLFFLLSPQPLPHSTSPTVQTLTALCTPLFVLHSRNTE